MPNWNDLLDEIKATGSGYDVVRRRYLKKLFSYTKRNVIAYYSGWLQKPDVKGASINDEDKDGLMTNVHKLDRSSRTRLPVEHQLPRFHTLAVGLDFLLDTH